MWMFRHNVTHTHTHTLGWGGVSTLPELLDQHCQTSSLLKCHNVWDLLYHAQTHTSSTQVHTHFFFFFFLARPSRHRLLSLCVLGFKQTDQKTHSGSLWKLGHTKQTLRCTATHAVRFLMHFCGQYSRVSQSAPPKILCTF